MVASVTAQVSSRAREAAKAACKRAFSHAIATLQLTQEQVAAELGVSVSRVRRLVSPDYPDVVPSTVDLQLAPLALLRAFQFELDAQRASAPQDPARVVARATAAASRLATMGAEALASSNFDGPSLGAIAREAATAQDAFVELAARAQRRAA